MNIKTKEFKVVEIYVEDKDYEVVLDFIEKKKKEGYKQYGASNPVTRYSENGGEEGKMYWAELTKKIEVS